jgi:hypothetical protein
MVPFDVKINNKKVAISWESLFWFFIVTAGATVLGELVYDKYVQPLLGDLPNLPSSILQSSSPSVAASTNPTTALPAAGMGRVVSIQPRRKG